MSGHSKWSQIKRQKEAGDIKKGQTFTKLANALTLAVLAGGGITDPENNFRLRLSIEKARAANMPKENIERAIRRAQVELESVGIKEVTYEGYGPGGVAIVVEAATDNKNRTTAEIKNIFERAGGNLTGPGSVLHLFKTTGLLAVSLIKEKEINKEKVMLTAIDSGAVDVEEVAETVLIYTRPEELKIVKQKLIEQGLKVEETELTRKPTTTIPLNDPLTIQKVLRLMDCLEEVADVQKVYANFDIPDNLLPNIKENICSS